MSNFKNLLKLNESNYYIDKTKPFGVISKGGSIGGNKDNYMPNLGGSLIATFDTADEAKEYARERRRMLSPGEKKYYGMTYTSVKLR